MAPALIKYGLLPEKNTAFFLCDLQEKFRPAMLHFEQIVEVANKLVQTSRILDIPLVVTEQHPKGLGHTVPELDVNHACGVFPKTKFSMVTPDVSPLLSTLCGGQLQCVVLFGVEAHVCVEQTAAELTARGFQVHIVADACTSRSQEDRLLAFQRLKQIGCFITTSETVIFKLLGDKEHPNFADIRPLIKTTSPNTGLAAVSKISILSSGVPASRLPGRPGSGTALPALGSLAIHLLLPSGERHLTEAHLASYHHCYGLVGTARLVLFRPYTSLNIRGYGISGYLGGPTSDSRLDGEAGRHSTLLCVTSRLALSYMALGMPDSTILCTLNYNLL